MTEDKKENKPFIGHFYMQRRAGRTNLFIENMIKMCISKFGFEKTLEVRVLDHSKVTELEAKLEKAENLIHAIADDEYTSPQAVEACKAFKDKNINFSSVQFIIDDPLARLNHD